MTPGFVLRRENVPCIAEAVNRSLKADCTHFTDVPDLLKLQLHDAIHRLQFYLNSLIHILLLSNAHNNVVSIKKNQEDKSLLVIFGDVCARKLRLVLDDNTWLLFRFVICYILFIYKGLTLYTRWFQALGTDDYAKEVV